MGEEITVEKGRISDFQGLVSLTLDRVILHNVMHHSSTSTCIPNFIEIEQTFCVRMDGRMDIWEGGRTFEIHFIRSTRRSPPKKEKASKVNIKRSNSCTLCLKKKRPTFKLSLTLSNLNRFSKFLHCWKAYEICYKSHMTIPTLP